MKSCPFSPRVLKHFCSGRQKEEGKSDCETAKEEEEERTKSEAAEGEREGDVKCGSISLLSPSSSGKEIQQRERKRTDRKAKESLSHFHLLIVLLF